jgi:ElaB/YqjD/DUF883 family membrane-anchored ribosome-binding protein
MKIEETLERVGERADRTIKHGKDLYERAMERTREGSGAVDRILRGNTYTLFATGILAGFVAGALVSRGCRFGRS